MTTRKCMVAVTVVGLLGLGGFVYYVRFMPPQRTSRVASPKGLLLDDDADKPVFRGKVVDSRRHAGGRRQTAADRRG